MSLLARKELIRDTRKGLTTRVIINNEKTKAGQPANQNFTMFSILPILMRNNI